MRPMIFSALILTVLLLALVACDGSTPAPTPTVVRATAMAATPTPTAPKPTATAAPQPTPLLPRGTKVPATMGAFFTYRGVTYTIVPGKAGRVWGVVGKVSVATALSTPVGPGKKVLLIAPASYYAAK
jgi:hypothetical protein